MSGNLEKGMLTIGKTLFRQAILWFTTSQFMYGLFTQCSFEIYIEFHVWIMFGFQFVCFSKMCSEFAWLLCWKTLQIYEGKFDDNFWLRSVMLSE